MMFAKSESSGKFSLRSRLNLSRLFSSFFISPTSSGALVYLCEMHNHLCVNIIHPFEIIVNSFWRFLF